MARVEGLILGALQGFDTEPFWESGIHSDVQLPANLTVGYAYVPSDKWAAEVDLGWTMWSVFADQNIVFDRPNATANALGTIPRNFHNSYSLNIGGHYRLNPKMDLLGGVFLYSDAAPTDTFDVVIPDSNRYATTFGMTYSITDKLDYTLTYLAILFERRSISNPGVLAKTGQSVDGEYLTFVHGIMTGFTYRFDGTKVSAELKPGISVEAM